MAENMTSASCLAKVFFADFEIKGDLWRVFSSRPICL